jgi:hypothetical protein
MLYHFLWKCLISSSIGFNLGNIININGIKTLEIQGSFKYKLLDFSSFSQIKSFNIVGANSFQEDIPNSFFNISFVFYPIYQYSFFVSFIITLNSILE